MSRLIRIGTRTSRLALAQSEQVGQLLSDAEPQLRVELIEFSTKGDRELDQPLPIIGGKGLFTAELEEALISGDIDIAVHSLKDLPVAQHPSLTIGAIVRREDAHDCLVSRNGWTLDTLPHGAVIGTSSPRRQAQLLAHRGDFRVIPVRGNVETRIRRALDGDCDAVVLAVAGLNRLGLTDRAAQQIPFEIMLPAPGQGALAVQCRSDDTAILTLLSRIDDEETRTATDAERRFLEHLGGGCSAPVGAYTTRQADGSYACRVFASDELGRRFKRRDEGQDVVSLSVALAKEALAHLSPPQPLSGRRIVVTRPEHQAGEFVDALNRLGATVIVAPGIVIQHIPNNVEAQQAIRNLHIYRWIVFTSANAVDAFSAELATAGLDASTTHGSSIAAVGPATEEALRKAGFDCDFVADQSTGEELASTLELASDDKILLPRSAIGNRDLPEILAARGAIVDDVPIYDTVPAKLDESTAASLQHGVDMVTFTSGSAVESLAESLAAHTKLADLLDQSRIACIGPKTADVVRGLGLGADVVADAPTIGSLIDAIVNFYSETRKRTDK